MFNDVIIDVPRLVRDLRSGDFAQGKSILHNITQNTYCCLGVACVRLLEDGVLTRKIVDDSFADDQQMSKFYLTDGIYSSRVLPEFVRFPAEMDITSAAGLLPSIFRDRNGDRTTLANLNDDGVPFSQISDILDYLYTNNVKESA